MYCSEKYRLTDASIAAIKAVIVATEEVNVLSPEWRCALNAAREKSEAALRAVDDHCHNHGC
jgi:hypothetical protein